jgi:predicted RNA-binding protein with RPS1 domain
MATFPSRAEEPDDLAPATLEAIKLARSSATRFRAREVSVHHLLLGLAEQGDAIVRHALKSAGIEARDVRINMERLFGPPNEGGETDESLPLSAEVLDCLNFARSLLPIRSSNSESLGNYYRQVSPALLFMALLCLPRIKVFLTSLLPSLKTIFTCLRQGMMSLSPFGISVSSANISRIEREISKEISPGWLLSTEDMLTSTRYSLRRASTVDQFLRSHLSNKARTWNIVRFNQGNVKRMLKCIVRPNPGGSFADLVGYQATKRQLQDLVDLLATPPEFRQNEQKPLHGVLLVGPADNDRTLLARAIAGEANVPLVTLSCDALVDMLTDLSMGTRTIEDLNLPIYEHNKLKQSDTTTAGQNLLKSFFKQAREDAPCLVLLDELDAVLRLSSNEAREHFFTQLLLEMDGLDKQATLIVVAAVSDTHELDPALFHTGRFDRIVEMQKDEAEEQTIDTESKGTDFDPWIAFVERYTPGQLVDGVVTRVVPFVLFVRVVEGIEGLVPRLMVSGKEITPEELSARFHENEQVTVRIRTIDAKRHRLSLSMHDVPQSTSPFERLCPSCQHFTELTWQYCTFCGTSLASICPYCGAPRVEVEGARFCFECGNALE